MPTKKTRLKGTKNLPRQFFPKTISLQLNRFSLAPCETTRLIYLPVVESSPTHAKVFHLTFRTHAFDKLATRNFL